MINYKERNLKRKLYRVVADFMNISESRVEQIYKSQVRKRENSTKLLWGDLSLRTINAFKKAGYRSLQEVKNLDRKTALNIKNIGEKTIISIFGRCK